MSTQDAARSKSKVVIASRILGEAISALWHHSPKRQSLAGTQTNRGVSSRISTFSLNLRVEELIGVRE